MGYTYHLGRVVTRRAMNSLWWFQGESSQRLRCLTIWCPVGGVVCGGCGVFERSNLAGGSKPRYKTIETLFMINYQYAVTGEDNNG